MSRSEAGRLLLVDDDPDYRRSLRRMLELEGYAVLEAGSLAETATLLAGEHIDLLLVDMRLTDKDDQWDLGGLEVTKLAAQHAKPCIIVTGYPSADTTRLALRSRGGTPLAEDYVSKDNGPQAVIDAVNYVLNRRRNGATNLLSATPRVLDDGPPLPPHQTETGLRVDLEHRLAFVDGRLVDLSEPQYRLLAYLWQRRGVVCSADELCIAVYEDDVEAERGVGDKRLERLVDRVRKKIEPDPANPCYLLTVRDRGLRLAPDPDDALPT